MFTFLSIVFSLFLIIVVVTTAVGVFFAFDDIILSGHFKKKVRMYFGVE